MVYAANAIHYGWAPSDRTRLDDLAVWLTALVLLALYWKGYRSLLKQERVSARVIVVTALPLVLVAVLTIPFDSTDVFLYMDIGWAQTHYGLNPYTNVLRDIPEISRDPMINAEWMQSNKNPWLDLAFVYGFAFALLTKAIAWMGQGNWWLTLVLFKLLNVGAYALVALLIWKLAKSSGQDRPDATLYLFMWSPLVLLHHIANAHNDLLTGALIVVAVALILRGRAIWSPAVLTFATMLKYAPLPLIPIALFYIARVEGWRRAMIAATGAALVAAILSLPFLGAIESFRFDLIAAQLNKITAGSMYAFFYYIFRFIYPPGLEAFGAILKVLLWLIGVAAILSEIYRQCIRRKPTPESIVSVFCFILFVIIFVSSSQFYSWYIGMLFPVVLLLDSNHWLRQLVVLLSAAHVLSLTSLRGKGIGYFALTTAMAVVCWWRSSRAVIKMKPS